MEIRHLDFYCERLAADFWAEPFNAISNAAFFMAGFWALYHSWKKSRGFGIFMSVLLLLVGVGSFLFHTFADNRTHLLDLIPIFLFTMAYLFYSLRYYLKWSRLKSTIGLVVVIGLMVMSEIFVPKSFLNGSSLYFPPLVMMYYVAFQMNSLWYKRAAFVFTLSLMVRTFDATLCEWISTGTHFMWHILNAVTLSLLMKVYLDQDLRSSTAVH